MDNFRRLELIALDDYRLAGCASWGRNNARMSPETLFANDLLAVRTGTLLHRRVLIEFDPENGFHASAGAGVHFGYCDTGAELRAEIDDHFAEEAEHYRGIDTPDDTPSLDTSFHDHEMNVG